MSFLREHIAKRLSRKRSWKWPKVRRAFVKENNVCACCGRQKGLEVHHIADFSTYPGLELDWRNLITLCRRNKCHIKMGHLFNWKSINPDVRPDCRMFLEKIRNRR